MKTIKELSDRQIKLAWISSKSLYEICKKLEIHDNTYNRKYLRVWGVKEGLKIPVFTRLTKTDYVKNPKLCKKCKKLFLEIKEKITSVLTLVQLVIQIQKEVL